MNENNTKTHNAITVGGILILLIALLVGISYLAPSKAESVAAAPVISIPDPFDGLALTAKAAIVYDIHNDKTLFAIEEETQLPLASIAKLLTTYLSIKELGENRYISILPEDLQIEGDSGLVALETWRVGDLARFSLMSSSNDGASALARAVSEKVGKTPALTLSHAAAALALPQTFALNGTGLDANEQMSGAYGSAKDIALLLGAMYAETRSLLLDSSQTEGVFASAEGFEHFASTTNHLSEVLPQLVGAKTGFTDLAGGNLAVLIEVAPGRPVAIVVLGSTVGGRFDDVSKLVEKTLEHYTY